MGKTKTREEALRRLQSSREKKQKLLEEMEKVACERFRNRAGENPKYMLSL